MINEYPPRLSVAELRKELESYLEHRTEQYGPGTVAADSSHVRQYLTWLETGLTRKDATEALMREYVLVDEV